MSIDTDTGQQPCFLARNFEIVQPAIDPGNTIWDKLFCRHPIRCKYLQEQYVYVIGLHAVQFGNNWMKKFRGRPNWTRPKAESNFAAEELLNLIISKLDKHVVLLPINYIS